MKMIGITGIAIVLAATYFPFPAFAETSWQEAATEHDRNRILKWKDALREGREQAGTTAEGRAAILARAPLFSDSYREEYAALSAGLYNCSVTKLGDKGSIGLPYIAYPAFKCRVVDFGSRKHFTKLTGSQRSIGWIYKDTKTQSVFLGSLIYGYEDRLVPYGKTKERDQAAVVQRIGPKRWRMVFPFPYYESRVDVMELTPVKE